MMKLPKKKIDGRNRKRQPDVEFSFDLISSIIRFYVMSELRPFA